MHSEALLIVLRVFADVVLQFFLFILFSLLQHNFCILFSPIALFINSAECSIVRLITSLLIKRSFFY